MSKIFRIIPVILILRVNAVPEEIIDNICKRKQDFEEILKKYVKIEERNVTITDEKGNIVKENFTISEIYWSNGKWMRKILKEIKKGITSEPGSIKVEKEKEILFPFNRSSVKCYQYEIKEGNSHLLVKAKLKSDCKGEKGLEGEFVISRETQYIEKAFLTFSKFHLILEPIRISIDYSKIDEYLIAPVKVESITISKKIFGIRRIAKVKSSFIYKRKD